MCTRECIERIEKATRFKKAYKYRPGNIDETTGIFRDIETLKENKIWMSRANLLDDPIDCKFEIKEDKELILERAKTVDQKFSKRKYRECLDNGASEIQRASFVCSFGKNADNDDLWSRYANNGKGFCIEYDMSSWKNRYCILEVEYSDKNMSILEFKNKCIAIMRILGTKKTIWNIQDELRAVAFERQLEVDCSSLGVLVDAPTVTGIYLGHNIDKNPLLKEAIDEYVELNPNVEIKNR